MKMIVLFAATMLACCIPVETQARSCMACRVAARREVRKETKVIRVQPVRTVLHRLVCR